MSSQAFEYDTCQRRIDRKPCGGSSGLLLKHTFFSGSTRGKTIEVCYPCSVDLAKKDSSSLSMLPNYAKSK